MLAASMPTPLLWNFMERSAFYTVFDVSVSRSYRVVAPEGQQ